MTRRRINRLTGLLLLVGFGAALVVYLTATPEPVDPLLGRPLHSKKYVRDLKLLGGNANVLSAEFQDWFASLWQGERLAGTIAVLTLASALTFRFVATHPDFEKPEPDEPKR